MEVEKGRYLEAILYPESMVDNWEDIIDDVLQVPLCYIKHDKDVDYLGEFYTDEDGVVHEKTRKVGTHVHCMIVWNNTVSPTFIKKLCNKLSKEGNKACSTVEVIYNVQKAYDYLIHDTEKARKERKHQYKEDERIHLNNFDIHFYRSMDENEKFQITKEISDIIKDYGFMDFIDLYTFLDDYRSDKFLEILMARHSYFDKLLSGNYKKYIRENSKNSVDKV